MLKNIQFEWRHIACFSGYMMCSTYIVVVPRLHEVQCLHNAFPQLGYMKCSTYIVVVPRLPEVQCLHYAFPQVT